VNFCTFIENGSECGRKAENRDLGLCATHNRQRIKSERPAPEQKPRAGLKPGKGFSTGSTLRPISDKQRVREKEKAAAYAIVDADEESRFCVSCGETGGILTHSHVLTDKQWPQHRANPRNILLECQECHTEWEHNKSLAKQKHASWAVKMEIWEELEPRDFQRFKDKFPQLFKNS
jgi:hypothetical protein